MRISLGFLLLLAAPLPTRAQLSDPDVQKLLNGDASYKARLDGWTDELMRDRQGVLDAAKFVQALRNKPDLESKNKEDWTNLASARTSIAARLADIDALRSKVDAALKEGPDADASAVLNDRKAWLERMDSNAKKLLGLTNETEKQAESLVASPPRPAGAPAAAQGASAGTKPANATLGSLPKASAPSKPIYERGAIIRGPLNQKRVALEFTGGSFADGGETILKALKKNDVKASFFLTGDFYRTPEFEDLIKKMKAEGHYLGPHSDKHPSYATEGDHPRTLISRDKFNADMDRNLEAMRKFDIQPKDARYFIPPSEVYTQEIATWAKKREMTLINYSPGTRTNADYMGDEGPSSEKMLKSVYARADNAKEHGLNGALLLMHLGAGPERTQDHLYDRLDEMIQQLKGRGYSFVRVDELLGEK